MKTDERDEANHERDAMLNMPQEKIEAALKRAYENGKETGRLEMVSELLAELLARCLEDNVPFAVNSFVLEFVKKHR